jgi:sulfate adenylyltransferase
LKEETTKLIEPYGGKLMSQLPQITADEELVVHAAGLPLIQLSLRALCDYELLVTGAFSPLDRFMGREEYQRVVEDMRLSDGSLFPIPITLPVGQDSTVSLDQEYALRDARNELLAIMRVDEIYPWDRSEAAERVFGTTDLRHPLVSEMESWGDRMVSGPITALSLPTRHDFTRLRLTPSDSRERLSQMDRSNVLAFQTRNPLHRAHEEIVRRAMSDLDATLLLHPVVGMTRPGDVDHYTRVRTYRVLADRYFERGRVLLGLIPLAMRMAGPREAVWHAVIRRNYGANHLVVGRDHASPGLDSEGNPFYLPYAAQELAMNSAAEIGITIVPAEEMLYIEEEDVFLTASELPPDAKALSISGSKLRKEFLSDGADIPDWYLRPEVIDILRETYPRRHRQGVCLWFTGLSGAGKSTTAEILTEHLLEMGRRVTLLDGDVVRTHLSHGLGFSKDDRDANVRRIGFVASEIVRHGGTVICAAVSPYRATRNDVRSMVGPEAFVEIFVDTPLEVCETRDKKGLYAKARRGEITGFTGIDDPYEQPENPEIVIRTVENDPDDNAQEIIGYLQDRGLIREPGTDES